MTPDSTLDVIGSPDDAAPKTFSTGRLGPRKMVRKPLALARRLTITDHHAPNKALRAKILELESENWALHEQVATLKGQLQQATARLDRAADRARREREMINAHVAGARLALRTFEASVHALRKT